MKSMAVNEASVYTQRPNDPEAVYFTPEKYGIRADGKADVSEQLQTAINKLKQEQNFGIIFIPEGTYKISRTIYVPAAIRLIGYGKKRPLFVLAKNSPGYQQAVESDKGKARYMFWFTGGVVEDENNVNDANAGTFYSAMSNINLKIEDGNPYAVALRTHFAQHSFVSNMSVFIGKGKAGLYDVGNEMENVAFYGGEYGIYTTKCSPGWQMMMVDSYFEGQRKAAIHCQEVGFTIVNLQAKDVPTVVEITPNYHERLFMEKSRFVNVSGPAIVVSNEDNANNQISLRNVECRNVPLLVQYRRSGKQTTVAEGTYLVKEYNHGLEMDSLTARPEYRTNYSIEPLRKLSQALVKDIPALPSMETWVNIKDLGAKGDGVTDDTKIFQDAINKYSTIYVPQGWYRFTETVKMKPGTRLIGLHPFATQFILEESTPAFSGFGAPKALLESSVGGNNMLNGIGINTGAYNYRAVGCKWMADANSYLNDVKFVGGHGTLSKGPAKPWGGYGKPKVSSPSNPVLLVGKDRAWDNQHWSLWITNNGGGTFKDIWTASTYSTNGLYVNNTSTPGRIYAISIEHHVRNEARFNNVTNWKVYALQMEEEDRESADCQPMELENCRNMLFANLYMFRTIRLETPAPYSVRTWNCAGIEFLNVHNYTQIKYTTNVPIYDINSDTEVRPWEFQRLLITGKEQRKVPLSGEVGKVERLASGFEFAEGIARDSKGNIYFCENRMRRIYKWSVETNSLSLLADFPWKPLSLACDTQDNLLVVFRYDPQPGYLIDGKQEHIDELPDANGTSFSGWGNSGFGSWVYAIDTKNPEESIKLLPKVPMGQIANVQKALYPSNRWRDYHDFNEVLVFVPKYCFVAPDGVTIIPECYDLARSSAVLEAYPGKPYYAADEYDKRMVKMDVAANGTLSNLTYFVERGEFGSAVDKEGNLYVADGQIYIYNPSGKEIGMIEVPERPSTIQFGGKEGHTLFITGRSALYSVRIK
nr:glycosyl hydrolase family 28-related protein [uncultured Bacteroides sp.]